MLKAEEVMILPDNVPANVNFEFRRKQTYHDSKTGRVWLHEYLQDFPEKNKIRYVML